VAIAHLVVLAVLLGGVQHSLRLCTTGSLAHAVSSAAAQASAQAPCHSESHGGERSTEPETLPACCGPLAAVVSIPSAGDARAALGATGTSSPALAPQLAATTDFRSVGAISWMLARMRAHPPSPRLRPHLVFESLLV
jgi:hypothetical protein